MRPPEPPLGGGVHEGGCGGCGAREGRPCIISVSSTRGADTLGIRTTLRHGDWCCMNRCFGAFRWDGGVAA